MLRRSFEILLTLRPSDPIKSNQILIIFDILIIIDYNFNVTYNEEILQ